MTYNCFSCGWKSGEEDPEYDLYAQKCNVNNQGCKRDDCPLRLGRALPQYPTSTSNDKAG